MEIHHHPQVEKKSFKEYFLEFLMIFLAVTMGFFAESLRENITDNVKEKEYIGSFIQNLKDDTTMMENVLKENKMKIDKLKKLMSFSNKNLLNSDIRIQFYKACNFIGYYSIFRSNDATMLQLKNSGGLRLIRKKNIADSISAYDNVVKIIYAAEAFYASSTDDAIKTNRQVLDYSFLYDSSYFIKDSMIDKRPLLITNDPQKIKFLFNMIDFEIGATQNYIKNIERRTPFTKRLIEFLKKEYNIKDE
jgi:hypothetical protein